MRERRDWKVKRRSEMLAHKLSQLFIPRPISHSNWTGELSRASQPIMLRLNSTISRLYGANAASMGRNATKWFQSPSVPLNGPSGAQMTFSLQSLSCLSPKTVYRTSVAAVNAAWRSLGPTTARSLMKVGSPTSKVCGAPKSRSLAVKSLKMHRYRTYSTSNWDNVQFQPRRSALRYLWSGTRSILHLSTMVLNAFSIYYLHSDLHKANPTWVSFFAFLPLLDWVPMLDIAGLDRLWCLLPAAAIGGLLMLRTLPTVSMLPIAVFVAPMYAFELYRNYHILSHFEQRNWPALLAWSIFRLEWVAMTGLAVLGTDRYQLVPHEQASFTESFGQIADRLEDSISHPEIVQDNNTSFAALHWIWSNVPIFRGARTAISSAVESSGINSFSDSISNKIYSLFYSNTSFPDLRAKNHSEPTEESSHPKKDETHSS